MLQDLNIVIRNLFKCQIRSAGFFEILNLFQKESVFYKIQMDKRFVFIKYTFK